MVKHSQTIRQLLPTNCLSVLNHFVMLTFKGLKRSISYYKFTIIYTITKSLYLDLFQSFIWFYIQNNTSITTIFKEYKKKLKKSFSDRKWRGKTSIFQNLMNMTWFLLKLHFLGQEKYANAVEPLLCHWNQKKIGQGSLTYNDQQLLSFQVIWILRKHIWYLQWNYFQCSINVQFYVYNQLVSNEQSSCPGGFCHLFDLFLYS